MMRKEYSSGIYIDSKPPVQESGELTIDGDSLVFFNENRTIRMPTDKINISIGGTANRTVYISSPQIPETKLYTTDMTILKSPAISGFPEVKKLIKEKTKQKNIFALLLFFITAFIILSAYTVIFEKEKLAVAAVALIPIELEERLGDTIISLQYSRHTIKNEEILTALEEMTSPLINAAKEDFDIKLHIDKNKTINAYAIPGGHIIINTGLLLEAENESQVLGVLSHEIAHINKRHSMRQLMQSASTKALGAIIASGGGDITEQLTQTAIGYTHLQYSREQELEADRLGLEYLVKAELPADGLLDFMYSLKEKEQHIPGQQLLEIFSTHPATQNRINHLQKLIYQAPRKTNELNFNYKKFKDRLKEKNTPGTP